MPITEAQQEMAAAHVRGAPAVFLSGLVWLTAGFLWWRAGIATGFAALFLGGMLIYPGSLLISQVMFRAPKASRGNPLVRLGLESTFVLFAGVLVGYAMLQKEPDLAFPVMAVVVGARYFIFRTIYDASLFWLLGGLIAAAGCLAALGLLPSPANLGLVVGVVELGFSWILFVRRPTSRT